MISKELQSSHLSSFSVNLTDTFKVIAKYRRKIISQYCQKLWEPSITIMSLSSYTKSKLLVIIRLLESSLA